MNMLKITCAALLAMILTGCAHPLQIAPNIAALDRPADAKPKVKANVAYLINEAQRTAQVTTPGGGGDKVSTTPYRDIETAFYKMLTNVFDNVITIKSAAEKDALAKNATTYVIVPTVTVNSSSSSMLTWPPTSFTIDLACDINDAEGKLIETRRVVGKGNAEFDEFKRDVALAGRRAMEDALQQMQRQLYELPARPGSAAAPAR